MDPAVLLTVAIAIVALVVLWRLRRRASKPALPFRRRPSLLNTAELLFYLALAQATPPGLAGCVKVRLMDVLWVPDGFWQEYGARGSGMHCDLVLADAQTLEPRLVVELDDRSHWRAGAQERDTFKDAALTAAGVPVLGEAAAQRYDAATRRARVVESLTPPLE